MAEHISRKELKQDKIHDAFEHGAEAVYSHKQVALIIVLVVAVFAAGYAGWSVYVDRQTAAASAAFDTAMKAYSGHIGAADPAGPGEASYPDEAARSNDAEIKFSMVADKYPNTNSRTTGTVLRGVVSGGSRPAESGAGTIEEDQRRQRQGACEHGGVSKRGDLCADG